MVTDQQTYTDDALRFDGAVGEPQVYCPVCADPYVRVVGSHYVAGYDTPDEEVTGQGFPAWLRHDRGWVRQGTQTLIFTCEPLEHYFAVQFGFHKGCTLFRVIVCPPGCDPNAP